MTVGFAAELANPSSVSGLGPEALNLESNPSFTLQSGVGLVFDCLPVESYSGILPKRGGRREFPQPRGYIDSREFGAWAPGTLHLEVHGWLEVGLYVINIVTLLMTPVITTHEPPSTGLTVQSLTTEASTS